MQECMEVNAQIHLPDAETHKKMHRMHKRTIAEVLNNLMNLAQIGPTELSRKTGVDQSTISRIRLGKIAEPRDSHVSALARHFGVNTEQLRGREPLPDVTQINTAPRGTLQFSHLSPRLQKETVDPAELANTEPGPEIKGYVPLISWVQAGNCSEAIDMFYKGDAEDWVECPLNLSKNTYALRIKGASMEPRFHEGEIIIVDPNGDWDRSGAFVIAKRTNENEVTFKQLFKDGGSYYLKALNPEWPERIIRMDREEWSICGVVKMKAEFF